MADAIELPDVSRKSLEITAPRKRATRALSASSWLAKNVKLYLFFYLFIPRDLDQRSGLDREFEFFFFTFYNFLIVQLAV